MHEQPCNLAVQMDTELKNIKPRVDDHERRIRSMEVRIAFIAGGAAAFGGTIGGFIGKNVDKVASVIEILKGVIYG